MTRYIAKFARGGFPELYEVLDTEAKEIIGEPKPYHEANDEAGQRNDGTWGQPIDIMAAFNGWVATLPDKP